MDGLAKQFVFVFTEAALRWRMGSAELMAEQVEHLAMIQRRPNVRIDVVPWSASPTKPPRSAERPPAC